MLHQVSEIGGVFALLVLVHFLFDWGFQSHDTAIAKSLNWKTRIKHCCHHTLPFLNIICFSAWKHWIGDFTAIGLILFIFLTHYLEDTYVPVMWWAKYIRKPLEMRWRIECENFTRLIGMAEFNEQKSESDESEGCMYRIRLLDEIAAGKLTVKQARVALDHYGFIEFATTPLGRILTITIDQVIHLVCLLPLAIAIVID